MDIYFVAEQPLQVLLPANEVIEYQMLRERADLIIIFSILLAIALASVFFTIQLRKIRRRINGLTEQMRKENAEDNSEHSSSK